MPRRRQAVKTRVGALTWDQELELQIGPGRYPAFTSDAAMRAAYDAHRDELMETAGPGRRPYAWWLLVSGIKGFPPTPTDRNGYVLVTDVPAEEAFLRKHGFLTAFEERELRRRRSLFDTAGVTKIAFDPDLGGAS